ncbi:MAG: glycosyltransferase, partial [Rhizobium sp.]|nr:glycosyltransferase [Rhizobium sp.]
FNQIFGSIMKVFVFFHLDRQKWTRQKTTIVRAERNWLATYRHYESKIYQSVSVLALVTLCSWLIGLTHIPRF